MKLKTNVIIISGKQGSGKSTVARLLMDELEAAGVESDSLKFAGVLYEMHNTVLSIMQQYVKVPEKDGVLLQVLGTEWGRVTYGEDVWCKVAKAKAKHCLKYAALLVIDDCRFPNELACFPKALKVRLECSEKLRKSRCSSWRKDTKHPSETALDHLPLSSFDRVYNTGKLRAEQIVNDIIRMLSH